MAKAAEFIIEDAELKYLNFRGLAKKFNKEGERNFACVLPDEFAAQLEADGWNVKESKLRDDAEEGEVPFKYIQIKVNYDSGRPPKVVMITSKGRTPLDENDVGMVDYADIKTVDFIAVPFNYDFDGNKGVSAYLKTMFVTINEDELERKYGIVDKPSEKRED